MNVSTGAGSGNIMRLADMHAVALDKLTNLFFGILIEVNIEMVHYDRTRYVHSISAYVTAVSFHQTLKSSSVFTALLNNYQTLRLFLCMRNNSQNSVHVLRGIGKVYIVDSVVFSKYKINTNGAVLCIALYSVICRLQAFG
jgi:hypothetical protein